MTAWNNSTIDVVILVVVLVLAYAGCVAVSRERHRPSGGERVRMTTHGRPAIGRTWSMRRPYDWERDGDV